MAETNWNTELSNLRRKFESGEIMKATRREMEWYLVVLANTRTAPPRFDQETHEATNEALAMVIRHLLQVRLGEELHWRSIKVSIIAIAISLVAAGFAGWQAWNGYQTSHSTTSLSTPAKSPSSTVQPMQAVLANKTNTSPVSESTSTNR